MSEEETVEFVKNSESLSATFCFYRGTQMRAKFSERPGLLLLLRQCRNLWGEKIADHVFSCSSLPFLFTLNLYLLASRPSSTPTLTRLVAKPITYIVVVSACRARPFLPTQSAPLCFVDTSSAHPSLRPIFSTRSLARQPSHSPWPVTVLPEDAFVCV